MTGWEMVGHWGYTVLVGLAVWCAVALVLALVVGALTRRR